MKWSKWCFENFLYNYNAFLLSNTFILNGHRLVEKGYQSLIEGLNQTLESYLFNAYSVNQEENGC